jgi:hypothetical protein
LKYDFDPKTAGSWKCCDALVQLHD